MNIIDTYTPKISELCKSYKVRSLYAFGSILTSRYTKDSDVDLIVDFLNIPIEEYADNYFNFKFSLQEIFNKPVDLLEEKAIRNPYFKKSIDEQKRLIYG